MSEHDQDLARAFDSQAPMFERAPVQSDPLALERLVLNADLPPGARVLDAGCGPGLVSHALLSAGFDVVGVDLSREMIERARRRCEPFGDRADFRQISVYDTILDSLAPFDAALSRYVLHHVLDPRTFLTRQFDLLRPGGILVVNDHVSDPDAETAAHHATIEIGRDGTHTRNLTGGELIDLFASVGLQDLRLAEESFVLDFDEWFDRGTPTLTKEQVRDLLLSGPIVRGFVPNLLDNGAIRIDAVRVFLRGVKPSA
jgi:2-polyprenyl-3-methyl-5-hydroxy-6-metoxy-1,4-benzoquinol methylase